MNHVSEWARIFDENAGRFRFKHKGTGVMRDSLMTIGKTLFNAAKPVAKKATTVAAEKTGQKLGQVLAEKGAQKIQNILRKRGKRGMGGGGCGRPHVDAQPNSCEPPVTSCGSVGRHFLYKITCMQGVDSLR